MRLGLLAAAFALGGILAAAGLAAAPRLSRAFVGGPHVLVANREPPSEGPLRPWLERLAARVAEREAYLRLVDVTERTSFAELGVELDVDATLASAERASRPVGFWKRVSSAFDAPAAPREVPFVFRFDAERARTWLEALAPRARRDPVNARLDLVGHRRIEDEPGHELDVSATLAAIARGERDELAIFPAAFLRLEPAVTSAALAGVDVTRVLASYETDFSKKPRSRVPNIRTAARYLNGVVLGPGEVLSFNRVVGARTTERGFSYAPVIVADELERGLGGGVCQVASTLFAAAMLGGFEIVERRSHSRPSGYAPLGLDAAVIWDEKIDLRLRNPYGSPVIVHAFLPTEKLLRIELLGREPPGKVEHYFDVHEKKPFTRRVVVKPDLAPGTIDRRQKGNQGYEGSSTLVVRLPDGTRLARSYRSKYYPVPEVFWIASDVETTSLPPLPEGAVENPEGELDDGGPAAGERDDGYAEP